MPTKTEVGDDSEFSCFFRRAELVAIATLVSLTGYVVMVFFGCFPLASGESELPVAELPVGNMLVFGVNMAVTGALL